MHDGREFSSTAQERRAQECSPVQVRPLRLPRLSAAWATWCTAVFAANLRRSMEMGGRAWLWEPVWHDALRNPAPAHWVCALHGSVGGQPFTCWLDSLLPLAAPPLREEDLALLPEAPLPEALLAAVMQDVAAHSLARLGHALGQQVTLDSLRCAPQEALQLEEGLAFTLTLVDADAQDRAHDRPDAAPRVVHGLLAAAWPHPFFAALYQAAEHEAAHREPALPDWPVACAVIWRTRPLALGDIRGLEPGDVLLMPCMADSEVMPVRVLVSMAQEADRGQSFFVARWSVAQRTVTLESAMQQDMTEYEANASQDAQEAMADRGEPASLEQCRVPIQCRLGEISVSLAELSALAPGAVLGPLDSVEAPVTLWLGATRLGRGALVDVDGRIGVRVTAIIPATHRG